MNSRNLARLFIAAMLAASLTTWVARPAGAVSNAALTVSGTVTYSPGLSSTPAAQTVDFQATGVLTVARHGRLSVIAVSCSFSGSSVGTEDLGQGTGSVSGGCSTTSGESMWMPCVATYQRVSTALTLTGWCSLGMADGTQTPTLAGTLTFDSGGSEPVTSAPGRMVVDLATAEPSQYALGQGYVYWPTWEPTSTTSFWASTSLAGLFVSGPNAEPALIGCSIGGYGPFLVVHEVAQGTASVSCGGTGVTGQAVTKQCTLPFALAGATLTMTGQCTLWVGGVATQVFENHSYALTLARQLSGSWTQYWFAAVGTNQAVAP